MGRNLLKPDDMKNSLSSNILSETFSAFFKSHSKNMKGMKLSMSIKDDSGWHTITQRLFKNGSIHIKKD